MMMSSAPIDYEEKKHYVPKVDPLVVAKLSVGHISMVPDDLANMLRWHIFLLGIHKSKLPLF